LRNAYQASSQAKRREGDSYKPFKLTRVGGRGTKKREEESGCPPVSSWPRQGILDSKRKGLFTTSVGEKKKKPVTSCLRSIKDKEVSLFKKCMRGGNRPLEIEKKTVMFGKGFPSNVASTVTGLEKRKDVSRRGGSHTSVCGKYIPKESYGKACKRTGRMSS